MYRVAAMASANKRILGARRPMACRVIGILSPYLDESSCDAKLKNRPEVLNCPGLRLIVASWQLGRELAKVTI
jgi:hypothetical protein